ncbi:DUF1028 domain-containing protein [Tenuibacillus multivorans]|uniref:Uncharacterized conserved protein, Ntn-hydrolase superfamily n=1 Tax=Tenuibacillus multivorans TaxID=237069 RepID=A0A1H0BZS0_9BACI|nr:DUF1028 domain-containing protein [Tenuibacillus multivorans]GEL78587.1 hypothetical protein TMU01_28220 [Tenuibacillus multivorans]SDN51171.1 Uncharacterized conserved protein, Ntn-hydrolase superfamily [Tenuibacillus multivorans]
MSKTPDNLVATFSIVGFDPKTGELGVATQSKFLGVGAVVPWAEANVGAVATQSMANTAFGPDGLKLLKEGKSAQEALDELVKDDPDASMRQVGVVDFNGASATFTGEDCYDWAGGQAGENYAAQGNILVGEDTVTALAETFESSEGEPLAERLIACLNAAQKAGGDKRGMQSAALFIVKEKGGYGGYNDRYLDLRVDDHESPIEELDRIYHLHRLYFNRPKAKNIVEIDEERKKALVNTFVELGYLSDLEPGDEAFYQALRSFIHTENFEEREQEQGKIDLELYDYIVEKQ